MRTTFTINPGSGDSHSVGRKTFIAYLRECAARWRETRHPGSEAQAERVEAKASRLEAGQDQ